MSKGFVALSTYSVHYEDFRRGYLADLGRERQIIIAYLMSSKNLQNR